jgi:polysaccharide pyruvyl transferase WcaK-like protein
VKICLVGWYGTETIGDRAILAGLISVFAKVYGDVELALGSLYPFFSERTISEDYGFWKEITNRDVKIHVFNSKLSRDVDQAIREADLIIMGGGPLMHIDELYMIEYAFRKAKKLGKKTAILGCGVGPLFDRAHRECVLQIAKSSDLIVLRDATSKKNLLDIFEEFNMSCDPAGMATSLDPAVVCVLEYNRCYARQEQSYVAINMRKFPTEYAKITRDDINSKLVRFVQSVSDKYNDREIRLIPMHYFHIGNDDREFLNSVRLSSNQGNLYVQNPNLSLKQTIGMFQNASFNIGMRFHAVVLQTFASGKNSILDYTEPTKGKISGFIRDVDRHGFYLHRYVCLQTDEIDMRIVDDSGPRFLPDEDLISGKLSIYYDKLQEKMP